MSQFHERTRQLLSTELRASSRAKSAIDQAEARMNVSLPASVREWYECETALQILTDVSRSDRVIGPDEFQLSESDGLQLLPVRIENQGVCEWAVLLDGSDDPPVLVNVDEAGWSLYSATFSDFVFLAVWDNAVLSSRVGIAAINKPLSDAAVLALDSFMYRNTTTHGWPGHAQPASCWTTGSF